MHPDGKLISVPTLFRSGILKCSRVGCPIAALIVGANHERVFVEELTKAVVVA